MRPMQRHLLNFRMQEANAQIVDDLHSGGLAGDEEEEFTCSKDLAPILRQHPGHKMSGQR